MPASPPSSGTACRRPSWRRPATTEGRSRKRMVYGTREVGPKRYREEIGRYFEDFKVGDVYEHRPGRTITEADNTWFTLLTMNTHPLHFDAEYAAKSEFGKPLVNRDRQRVEEGKSESGRVDHGCRSTIKKK